MTQVEPTKRPTKSLGVIMGHVAFSAFARRLSDLARPFPPNPPNSAGTSALKSSLGAQRAQAPQPETLIEIGKNVIVRISKDNLMLVAAGVAFYAMTAIFPAIFFGPWRAIRTATAAPDRAAAADRIRKLIQVNLVLGALTVLVAAWGQ